MEDQSEGEEEGPSEMEDEAAAFDAELEDGSADTDFADDLGFTSFGGEESGEGGDSLPSPDEMGMDFTDSNNPDFTD